MQRASAQAYAEVIQMEETEDGCGIRNAQAGSSARAKSSLKS